MQNGFYEKGDLVRANGFYGVVLQGSSDLCEIALGEHTENFHIDAIEFLGVNVKWFIRDWKEVAKCKNPQLKM